MIRDEHIEAAVAQGIITSDRARRLRALAVAVLGLSAGWRRAVLPLLPLGALRHSIPPAV